MRLAGAWLARKDRGFTPAESGEFEIWMRADASHAAAVAQLERTMAKFDRLRELAPGGSAIPDRDALAPRRSRRPLAWFAALGAAAAITLFVWLRVAPTAETWQFATPAGGYDRATLVDGSTVDLNSDTAIAVTYTRAGRQVRLLRGEAHFQVAANPARPFIVDANAVSVRAVGTAFNVRLANAGVEVLVTHGRVQVAPPLPPFADSGRAAAPVELPLLSAGHKVTVSTAAQSEPARIAPVSSEDLQRALSWQRVVEFNRTPLGAAVAEFNRQNARQIVVQDPELEALRIGGSFRTDQPEAFVRLLETSFGIAAERAEDRILLRRKSGAEAR